MLKWFGKCVFVALFSLTVPSLTKNNAICFLKLKCWVFITQFWLVVTKVLKSNFEGKKDNNCEFVSINSNFITRNSVKKKKRKKWIFELKKAFLFVIQWRKQASTALKKKIQFVFFLKLKWILNENVFFVALFSWHFHPQKNSNAMGFVRFKNDYKNGNIKKREISWK